MIYFSAFSAVELYCVLTNIGSPLPVLPGNFRWAMQSEFQISHSLRFLSLWCVWTGLFLTPSTFYSALLVPKYILSFYFISCSIPVSPDKYLPSPLHPLGFPFAPGFEHVVIRSQHRHLELLMVTAWERRNEKEILHSRDEEHHHMMEQNLMFTVSMCSCHAPWGSHKSPLGLVAELLTGSKNQHICLSGPLSDQYKTHNCSLNTASARPKHFLPVLTCP